jgi:hypothetical protein
LNFRDVLTEHISPKKKTAQFTNGMKARGVPHPVQAAWVLGSGRRGQIPTRLADICRQSVIEIGSSGTALGCRTSAKRVAQTL